MNDAPGYFGKVAAQGDFVRRRLPADFIAHWDGWLQEGLRQSQARMGAGWLDAYLHGPVWCFALAAGLCGEQAMAGILMPSIDRVGRYFPLTLAAPVEGAEVPVAALLGDADGWFEALEQLALGSLVPGATLAGLEAALAGLADVATPPRCAAGLDGHALFWMRAAPSPQVFTALPPAADFGALLAPSQT